MRNLTDIGKDDIMPGRKSQCHGAPVRKLQPPMNGKKYFCTDCEQPCIPIRT